jgi:hypothetical protein
VKRKPKVYLLPTVWVCRTLCGHFYPIQPSNVCKAEDHGKLNPDLASIEDANGVVLWRRVLS